MAAAAASGLLHIRPSAPPPLAFTRFTAKRAVLSARSWRPRQRGPLLGASVGVAEEACTEADAALLEALTGGQGRGRGAALRQLLAVGNAVEALEPLEDVPDPINVEIVKMKTRQPLKSRGHRFPRNVVVKALHESLTHLPEIISRHIIKRGGQIFISTELEGDLCCHCNKDAKRNNSFLLQLCALPCFGTSWLCFAQAAQSSEGVKLNMVYEVGELFELGIQLSYLLILLGLLGAGTFFVIRQVLVRRELDLSAKELQEQVRSGDASATEYFELGAVMLRRKFYPAATKYLQQAIQKWDRDEQDLAQVYNALGVSYIRDNKLDKAIQQFEKAVQLQPGYVTAWNNLGDAYEQKKDLKSALKAFEEVLLFDPNNKVARPRRDDLRERVRMYKGVSVKSEKR